MKYLLLIIGLCSFQWLGAQIKLDLDFDDKLDEVYLTTVGEKSVRMDCLLSTRDYKLVSSSIIHNDHPEGFFTLRKAVGKVYLGFHIDYVERINAVFEYDRMAETLVLVKMERSVDGDNDINEAGSSTLEVTAQKYIGEWSYYDYQDAIPDLYRIEMPKISVGMKFPKVRLDEFNDQVFTDYRVLCKKEYKKQLKTIFPEGNTFVNGALYVDLDNDYSVDTLYLDTYSSRIKSGIIDKNGYVEISSEPTGFYADDNFKILEIDDYFVLQSTVDNQRIDFKYDKKKQRFIVLHSTPSNLIYNDLDGDGLIDSVKVQMVDNQLQYVCQLSTQGFKKIKSGLFYATDAKIDASSKNLLLELFFERSGVNALFQYDAPSQSMHLANIDSWYMYDDVSQDLNMETGVYKASKMEEDNKTLEVSTTLYLPPASLSTFDDNFLSLYYEKTFDLWNKVSLHKELEIGFGIIDNIFSVYADEPIDLEGRSFKDCEISLRITDVTGHQQDFFVSKFDMEGTFVALYDNEIHYDKDLGYYIEESTSIFPKGLAPGLYKIQCVISHPDFLEDEVSEIVEYRIEK